MGVLLLAVVIAVVAIVAGIIVALTSSIITGVIIAAIGWGVAVLLGAMNFYRIWKDPRKLL